MVSAIVTVAISSGNISTIASIAVFGIFVVYAMVNLSLIWLRFKNPSLARLFVSPLKVGRFPILAGAGLFTSLAMLFQFNADIIIGGSLAIFFIVILCMILVKIRRSANN
jgi:amino acid transporter